MPAQNLQTRRFQSPKNVFRSFRAVSLWGALSIAVTAPSLAADPASDPCKLPVLQNSYFCRSLQEIMRENNKNSTFKWAKLKGDLSLSIDGQVSDFGQVATPLYSNERDQPLNPMNGDERDGPISFSSGKVVQNKKLNIAIGWSGMVYPVNDVESFSFLRDSAGNYSIAVTWTEYTKPYPNLMGFNLYSRLLPLNATETSELLRADGQASLVVEKSFLLKADNGEQAEVKLTANLKQEKQPLIGDWSCDAARCNGTVRVSGHKNLTHAKVTLQATPDFSSYTVLSAEPVN